MIHFEWPWLILALPLPLFVRWFMQPLELNQEAALRVPFIDEIKGMTSNTILKRKQSWPLWLAVIAWCLFVIAAMRPQWLGDWVEIPVTGRDLMLAVDLSGSMQEEDFLLKGKTIDRLTATKWVAGNFIERRVGDRIGLILFGEQAYLQAPLTFDRETVKTLLYESLIGLAGKMTAIGDGIGLAIKRLKEKKEGDKILILLTDGANTAGVDPIEAAALAAREELKIYTIGIGADEKLVRSLFGVRRINPSSDLDEETLAKIAEQTGGRYFRARNTDELEAIYALIDELEPTEKEAERFRPRKALYIWPLAFAAILTILLTSLKHKGRF